MRKLIDVLVDAGCSAITIKKAVNPPAFLETIERCVKCKKSFKFRYGYIYSCQYHEGLEPVAAPPPFQDLKEN